MAQEHIRFEWRVGEDGDWGSRPLFPGLIDVGGQILSTGERRLLVWLGRLASVVSVLIAVAAGAAPSPELILRDQLGAAMVRELEHEVQSWVAGDWRRFEASIDPEIEGYWINEWRDAWRMGPDADGFLLLDMLYAAPLPSTNLVQVAVQVDFFETDWRDSAPYREMRYYRRTESGWLRTLPSESYWGEPQTLETDHLRFVYYGPDAATVQTAAPWLERTYVDLYAFFDLAPPESAEKLSVVLLPDLVKRWTWSSDLQLDMTSPRLTKVPAANSDDEYLKDRVSDWLTYRLLRDVSPGFADSYLYRWPLITWGVRGWLREDLSNRPNTWHEEAKAIFRAYYATRGPLRLDDIGSDRLGNSRNREDVIARYMTAESVAEYVVVQHGRERLPDFVWGLIEYDNWEELTLAVFAVPAAEFEAGWNNFLNQ